MTLAEEIAAARAAAKAFAGPGQEVRVQQAWVPVDDEHNYFFSLRFKANGPLVDNHRDQFQMDAALRPRGWAGMHWSPAIGAEHRACREGAALFD